MSKYEIKYISAEVFDATDKNGKSDPYLRIGKLKKENVFSKKFLSHSSVKEKTLKAYFDDDEIDTFELSDKVDQLVLEMWDKDLLKDDFIGRSIFPVSKIGSKHTPMILQLFKVSGENYEPAVGVAKISIRTIN